jgi:hypothetical protein
MKQMGKILQFVIYTSHLIAYCEVVEPRWAGNVSRVRETRNVYRILVGNPFATLGRQRTSSEKINISEIGWEFGGTGSGSVLIADFGVSGAEPSGSTGCRLASRKSNLVHARPAMALRN